MAFPLKSKFCSSCNLSLDISHFGKRTEYRDGYRNQCNECRSQKQAAYQRARGHRKRKPPQPITTPEQSAELRRTKLRLKYGLSEDDFARMLAAQSGGCAICGTDKPSGRYGVFCVDHCHETGRIRGLLCLPCNSSLGRLGDTEKAIERVLSYVRNPTIVRI